MQCCAVHTLPLTPFAIPIFWRFWVGCSLIFIIYYTTNAQVSPPFLLDRQWLTSQYNFDHWTTVNGLPNNSVMKIKQTDDGYIWMATYNGVVRFDGVKFTIFSSTTNPELHTEIVELLIQDRVGNIWMSLQGVGVLRYHRGKFSVIGTAQGLLSAVITAICEDADGSIVVATNKGINRLLVNDRDVQIITDTRLNAQVSLPINTIQTDFQNNLWLGTDKGLYKVTRHTVDHFTTSHNLPDSRVLSLSRDSKGALWAGTILGISKITPSEPQSRFETPVELQNLKSIVWSVAVDADGAYWFASNSGLWYWKQPLAQQLTVKEGLSDNSIRDIMIDREGNIWCATYYGGITRLKKGVCTNITRQEGLAADIVYSILWSKDSSLWVGQYGGIQRYKAGVWQSFAGKNWLQSDVVRCVAEDSAGYIWLATYHGLYQVDPVTGKPKNSYFVEDGLLSNQIRILCCDKQGVVWVGTTRGLNKIKDGKVHQIPALQHLSLYGILGLYQDKHHRLWVATNNAGIFVVQADTIYAKITEAEGLPSSITFCFAEDFSANTSGDMWIGANGGLCRLRLKAGRTIQVQTLNRSHGLLDNDFFQILDDQAGNLWLGCNLGILRIAKTFAHECADGKRTILECTLFNHIDGMKTSNCTVPGIAVVTPDKRLMFPTLKGISLINPSKNSLNSYKPPVVIEQIRSGSRHFTPDSLLRVMPDMNSIEIHYTALSFFAPEKIRFRYKLEGIDPEWIDAAQRRTAFYTHLPPGTFTFSVQACNSSGVWNETAATLTLVIEPYFYQTRWFAVLCLIVVLLMFWGILILRTRRVRHHARHLEALVHERTIALEASREEVVRQLDVLHQQSQQIEQVNSRLLERNDELERASVEIQRQQQILETQAAEIEISNTELQSRNLQLEQLNLEKNEFLGIVAHDLKNPLTSIQMSASIITQYFHKLSNDDIIERSQAIVATSKRMTTIITNLLDINAIEAGKFTVLIEPVNLGDIILQLCHEYKERAAQKSISIHFSADNAITITLSDQRLFVEIADNLLSNAVKYSPHYSTITVELQSNTETTRRTLSTPDALKHCFIHEMSVLLVVQDEGPGIHPDEKEKLFGKFVRLASKPTGGESSTGLGLSIVKKMVEAISGRVWCESELGKGTRFIVQLPLVQPELSPDTTID